LSIRVDPSFIDEIKHYGAFDISACFNCGTCTAICPLSEGTTSFPRKLIRYAQIGSRELVISNRELWLCYYCGECSDTCPREAEPGEFMASARRYAIASFDPSGISRLLYRSRLFTAVFMTFLSVLFALIMLSKADKMNFERPAFFKTEYLEGFIPFKVVHDTGLAVIIIAAVSMIVGVWRMWRKLSGKKSKKLETSELPKSGKVTWDRIRRAFNYVVSEIAAEKRYRDCEEDKKAPWFVSRWFVHWSIMWGFIGLGTATVIDYILLLTVGKDPGQAVPLWNPPRLLGTLAGILLMYGTSLALYWRFRKKDKYHSHSLLSDWLFLWLMFLAGFTGFLLEIAIYLPSGTLWGYIVFLIHVVIGMEIVVLLPFTKFAHAVYRPIALFFNALSEVPVEP